MGSIENVLDLPDMRKRAAALEEEASAPDLWDDQAKAQAVTSKLSFLQGEIRKADVISGLDQADAADAKVFHAGTSLSQGHWVTAGGRVLCVTALGEGVRAAQHLAYEAIQGVAFRGMQFRRDIGFRALSH